MNIAKRELTLIYIIVALLGIWFIAKIIFFPFQEKLNGLDKDVLLQETKLKKSFDLIDHKEEINKSYDEMASYFSFRNMSDEEAVASFLKEIEKMGRQSGVTILDMKPLQEPVADKSSKQYQISIKAEANLNEFVNFLYMLHTSQLLFSVEKLNMAPKSENSPDLTISMSIIGVAFS
jgi:hypothetical protein